MLHKTHLAPKRGKKQAQRLSIALLILMAASVGVMRFGAPTAQMDSSLGNIPVGSGPATIAVNPLTNKIYVVNFNSGNVTVIDGASNTVTATVPTGSSPTPIAVNPVTNKIYVGNQDDDNVTVIDGSNNSTQTIATGARPYGIAVNTITNKIYVANRNGNSVSIIDGNTNATQTVAAGTNPFAVAVNSATNKIYVTNRGSNNVTVIDGSNNSTATVAAILAPISVAVNSVTNKIYVPNGGSSNNVTIIDGATNATTTAATGSGSSAVGVNSLTNKIYVANQSSNTVSVIDGANNSTQTVAVGTNPTFIAVNPVTNKIYVSNQGSNNVTVIDGTNNSTQTIAVGNFPQGSTVNPVTSRIYVANFSSNSVTAIDGAPATPANIIDLSTFFVQQQYLDFLNRLPDDPGFAFWNNQITSCNGDATCIDVKRQNVSAAYFLSPEFQETGFFVIKVQRAAFGRVSNDSTKRITFQQFLTDSQAVGKGVVGGQTGADQLLDQNKTAYAQSIVNSSGFTAKYPTSLSASAYVDALFQTAGVTPQGTERQDAITAFGAGDAAGRAAALRKVAESNSVKQAEFNAAFVLLQYFGYLRRNPTDLPDTSDAGYQFWLGKLNGAGGDYIASQMVRSFIVSQEYRKRFGIQ